MVKELL